MVGDKAGVVCFVLGRTLVCVCVRAYRYVVILLEYKQISLK